MSSAVFATPVRIGHYDRRAIMLRGTWCNGRRRIPERVRTTDPDARFRNALETPHDIFTPAVSELERDVNAARLLGRLDRHGPGTLPP